MYRERVVKQIYNERHKNREEKKRTRESGALGEGRIANCGELNQTRPDQTLDRPRCSNLALATTTLLILQRHIARFHATCSLSHHRDQQY